MNEWNMLVSRTAALGAVHLYPMAYRIPGRALTVHVVLWRFRRVNPPLRFGKKK
jgi:hypothetical protein